MTGQELIDELKIARPDLAITVSKILDVHFQWDGDGPDPALSGYDAYDVLVNASVIRGGEFVEASDSLGGSYYLPYEGAGEVNGYLVDMVRAAVRRLDAELKQRVLQ